VGDNETVTVRGATRERGETTSGVGLPLDAEEARGWVAGGGGRRPLELRLPWPFDPVLTPGDPLPPVIVPL
jgi:hypothetical protein